MKFRVFRLGGPNRAMFEKPFRLFWTSPKRYIMAVERYHWPFDDPSKFTGSEEEVMAKIRVVRDQIKKAVMEFIDRDN